MSNFRKSRFVKYGAPFFAIILGGAGVLRYSQSIRYEYSRQKRITPEEAIEMGFTIKKPEEVTLNTEFDKIKDLDIHNWENKRGPRPWEPGNESAKPKSK